MFYMILSLTTSNGVQRKGGLEHRCNRKFGRFCLRGWFLFGLGPRTTTLPLSHTSVPSHNAQIRRRVS